MEVIKKVESREDYKKWLLDTHGIFCVKGFSEEPNTSLMPNTAKLALIQEWIETKSIELETHYEPDKDGYYWYLRSDEISGGFDYSDEYDTRSQALAKGIEEALKLIDKAQ